MVVEAKPVKHVQAEIFSAAEELEEVVRRLELVPLLTELERNYPRDMDREAVGDGDACPPLAWEVASDLGNAKILLEEAIRSLRSASQHTHESVRKAWLESRLESVSDPAIRSLFGFILSAKAAD
jgi:hypothetical protein